MTREDNLFVIQAFELARQHGLIEAKRICRDARDMNAEGTASFALHNAVYKKLCEFAESGSMFRPVRAPLGIYSDC